MKILILPIISLTLLISCGTSKNVETEEITTNDSSMTSIEWPGVYAGTSTKKDGESIHAQVILTESLSFEMTNCYSTKSESFFKTNGTFTWDKTGSILEFGTINDGMSRYIKVGENKLWEVNEKGQELKEQGMELTKIDSNFFALTWSLAQLEGDKVKTTGTWPTIHFDENGKLSGNGSCNQFSGSYILGGEGYIQFGVLAATKKMCPESMDLENTYFNMLSKAVSYSVEIDLLYLKNAEGAVLAVFKGSR